MSESNSSKYSLSETVTCRKYGFNSSKDILSKLQTCLLLRSKVLKSSTGKEITLDEVKSLRAGRVFMLLVPKCLVFENLFTDKEVNFPIDISTRKQLLFEKPE